MKLDYKKTFLIGFGFFATSVWVIYNNYVPIFLKPLTAGWHIGGWEISSLAVGAIMTIDNIFGVIFQPLVGAISDRTHTKIGKRMPYILIGIPICAALFALVPLMKTMLLPLMLTIILFNLVMSTWRSPVVALMPDLTPAPLWSKANGVINMMGGIGGLIAFFAGGFIFNTVNKGIEAVDQVRDLSYVEPFLLGTGIMILAVIVVFFFVKEPSSLAQKAEAKAEKKEKERLKLDSGERKSLILILLAIFFWFTGYNAIESFFSLFATNTLTDPATGQHLTGGQSSIMLGVFTVSLIITAIPAGMLGSKIGRRKTILIGLAGITALFIPMFFVRNIMAMYALLFLSGSFWAFININSLPMVVELAGAARIGTFTGYYYTFSCSSAIASPILFGALMSLTGDNYPLMFIYAAIAFVAAIACISFVKHGEAKPSVGAMEAVGMQEN
jgi:maltose/moltooligosaccharide transporter